MIHTSKEMSRFARGDVRKTLMLCFSSISGDIGSIISEKKWLTPGVHL